MGNSQDVCLLYVSDDVTDVTVEYDTERNFDFWIGSIRAQDPAATQDEAASRVRQTSSQLSAGTRIHRLRPSTSQFSSRRPRRRCPIPSAADPALRRRQSFWRLFPVPTGKQIPDANHNLGADE
jgi:hypothetical protein